MKSDSSLPLFASIGDHQLGRLLAVLGQGEMGNSRSHAACEMRLLADASINRRNLVHGVLVAQVHSTVGCGDHQLLCIGVECQLGGARNLGLREGHFADGEPVAITSLHQGHRVITSKGEGSLQLPLGVASEAHGGKPLRQRGNLQLAARPASLGGSAFTMEDVSQNIGDNQTALVQRDAGDGGDQVLKLGEGETGQGFVCQGDAVRSGLQEGNLVSAGGHQRGAEFLGPSDLGGLKEGKVSFAVGLVLGGFLLEGLGQRSQSSHQLGSSSGDLILSLKTTIATTSMAPLVARTLACPRSHPGLHVGRPTLHSALLLQDESLAVQLLKESAAHDQDPHTDEGHQGSSEELPREHRGLGVAGLLGLDGVAFASLGGLHLLQEASVARFQSLGGGDEVHRLLEGRRNRPGRGVPAAPWALRLLLLELGHGELVHAQSPGEVNGVADPRQGVDESLQPRGGVQDAVVDAHAQNAQVRDEGDNLLHLWHLSVDWGDDVQVEDAEVGRDEHGAGGPGRPEASELSEDVAHRVQTGSRQPVRKEVEQSDTSIDVVAPPLLLETAIELKVLWVRLLVGCGAALVRAQVVDLVVVPSGHTSTTAGGDPDAGLGVKLGFLLSGGDEGDSEDVDNTLLLEFVTEHSGLVQHFGRGDWQTNSAGEHVRHAGVGAGA
mmetsp:Transcript_15229/g.32845  ORF Transcript_15229/g.32845 Transcript_15229/m.32845 type:complete len:665 (+) Transcript_15229:418-2412(+)